MTDRTLNRFSNLLLLLLFILPISSLLVQSFDYSIDDGFLFWLISACVLLWFISNFRRGTVPGIILSVFMIFAAHRKFSADFRNELSDFFDKLTGVYYEHYYAIGSKYNYANSAESHTFILFLVLFLLAAYMAMSLSSKSGRTTFSLLGSLPVFIGCIAVNGHSSVLNIVCLMTFWILLLAGGNFYNIDGRQGRTTLLLILPVVAALYAVVIWQKPSEYDYGKTPTDMVTSLDKLGTSLSHWLSGETDENSANPPKAHSSNLFESAWGMGDGKLDMTHSPGDIDMEKVILRVRADTDGYIYLRNFSYGDYTGTGWQKPQNPDSVASSLNFIAEAMKTAPGSTRHDMDIRFSSRPDIVSLPYYSSFASDNDSFVLSSGDRNYSLTYTGFNGDLSDLNMPEKFQKDEWNYSRFAHGYYTRLPENTKIAVLSLAHRAGIYAESENLISAVADLVQNAAVYDINTAPYPSEDHALYFLQEAESGYCIHFATAAAVMYRALGIPARVTDGFLFYAKSGEYVDVKQSNEHAWVEVYMDGLGWLPVEVTGSSGFTANSENEPTVPEISETPNIEETAPLEEPKASEPPLNPKPETKKPPVGIISSQPQNGNSSSAKIMMKISRALPTILLSLFFICVLPMRRIIGLRMMRSRISQSDRRKAAVWVWKYAVKTSKFGIPVPESITHLAEKAAFSPHSISENELRSVRGELNTQKDKCFSSLSGLKRFIFKYIFSLK